MEELCIEHCFQAGQSCAVRVLSLTSDLLFGPGGMLVPSHKIYLVDSQPLLHTSVSQKYFSQFSRCKRRSRATACIVPTTAPTPAQSLALTWGL